MVQVVIKKGNILDEWFIIELQGELESRYNNGLAGSVLGDLNFNKKGQPILIIGHHMVLGKTVSLDKPIAVLVKCKQNDPVDSVSDDVNVYEAEHCVKAIIKTKLVFVSRPKPIILHVPKKA